MTDPGSERQPDLDLRIAEAIASRGPLDLTAPAFPDGNGKRRNKDQANKQTIGPAVHLANEWRADRGERPLPHVTPHTLRYTYITLAFEANFPLPYVMEQVGQDDSRTTTDIYAKVSRRRDRAAHGAAFDRVVAEGSEHVATSVATNGHATTSNRELTVTARAATALLQMRVAANGRPAREGGRAPVAVKPSKAWKSRTAGVCLAWRPFALSPLRDPCGVVRPAKGAQLQQSEHREHRDKSESVRRSNDRVSQPKGSEIGQPADSDAKYEEQLLAHHRSTIGACRRRERT